MANVDYDISVNVSDKIRDIIIECKEIIEEYQLNNNLTSNLRKFNELYNKFHGILRQRYIWEEWIKVDNLNPFTGSHKSIYQANLQLSKDILKFCEQTERDTWKFISKFDFTGLTYRDSLRAEDMQAIASFCCLIEVIFKATTVLEDRLFLLKKDILKVNESQ